MRPLRCAARPTSKRKVTALYFERSATFFCSTWLFQGGSGAVQACFSVPIRSFFARFATALRVPTVAMHLSYLSEINKKLQKIRRNAHRSFHGCTYKHSKIVANALRQVFFATNVHRYTSDVLIVTKRPGKASRISSAALATVWGGPGASQERSQGDFGVSLDCPGSILVPPQRIPGRPGGSETNFFSICAPLDNVFARTCSDQCSTSRVSDVFSLDNQAERILQHIG